MLDPMVVWARTAFYQMEVMVLAPKSTHNNASKILKPKIDAYCFDN